MQSVQTLDKPSVKKLTVKTPARASQENFLSSDGAARTRTAKVFE